MFNPATPLHHLDHVMDRLDVILLMSVNPGFGGQSFIPETLNKLRAVRQRIDAYTERTGRKILLEVDGGVKVDNIAEIAAAGAIPLWPARPCSASPMRTAATAASFPRCAPSWPRPANEHGHERRHDTAPHRLARH